MDIKPTQVILIFLILFGMRVLLNHFFDPTVYKTDYYSVKVPKGWGKEVKENSVTFISPQKDPETKIPEAIFSIYGKKSKSALFLDELYAEVVQTFRYYHGKVLDQGDVNFAGYRTKWNLFHMYDPELYVLSFYIVDDYNRFTKIQFSTRPELFHIYREEFEAFKNSIKIKSLF